MFMHSLQVSCHEAVASKADAPRCFHWTNHGILGIWGYSGEMAGMCAIPASAQYWMHRAALWRSPRVRTTMWARENETCRCIFSCLKMNGLYNTSDVNSSSPVGTLMRTGNQPVTCQGAQPVNATRKRNMQSPHAPRGREHKQLNATMQRNASSYGTEALP